MPDLSLTDFVDIVARSGTPKLTKIREVKTRPDYEPAFDFYKPLRDRIVEVHRGGLGKAALRDLLRELTDRKKETAYPNIIDRYVSWWGRKQIGWFRPPGSTWRHNSVAVSVNPELGLSVNGVRHAIKLYFKSSNLSQVKVDVILHLMNRELPNENVVMAVLDVRQRRLFTRNLVKPELDAMLAGEAAYVEAVWAQV